MVASETRFGLLVRLAWELRSIPVTSLLVIPDLGEPVLYVRCASGRRDAVLAVLRDSTWRLLWRGRELDAAQLAVTAGRIAREAAA